MRHAGPAALVALDDLLAELRRRDVKEIKRGVFYRRGKAWLHFHEDPAGLFADLRVGADWQRFRVSEPAERVAFLAFVEQHC